jgi:site-specific DNA-methyltransferase (adenine-specific)
MNRIISEATNEDCMVMMARYPDKFFDLAIVDPPYGIDAPNMKVGQGGGLWKSGNYSGKDWDKDRPSSDYFKELFRVSKNQIIWGYNHLSDLLPPTKSIVMWDKVCHPKHSCDLSDGELAWCSIGGKARIFRFLWMGMMQGSTADGTMFVGDLTKKEKRIHPTQKPIHLYKWLLKTYAPSNNIRGRHDRILDTHMGSQSSRIAAFNMGFDYWGTEIDKEYFDKGNQRFKEQTAQLKLL